MPMNTEKISRNAIIIEYFKQSLSQREISAKTSTPRSTVKDVINKFKHLNTTTRKKGSGRRHSLDAQDRAIIFEEIKKNPKISSPKLATELLIKKEKVVSCSTVRRGIQNLGFSSRVPKNVPLMSQKNWSNSCMRDNFSF